MPDIVPGLELQLECLMSTRQRCVEARARYESLRAELQQLAQEATEAEQRAVSDRDTGRMFQRERLASALRRDLEQYSMQFEAAEQSLQRRLETRLTDFRDSRDDAVEACERKLESELWVLQSVCDETSDDSPVGRLERARDTFDTQQQMLKERFDVLSENATKTQEFLGACHAAPDTELPPPAIKPAAGDSARQQVVDQIEHALSQIRAIGKMRLPHVVYGLRLVMLWLLMFVLTFVAVTSIRADLRSFLVSNIPQQDIRWLGISAIISLIGTAFVCLVVLLVTQQKLRSRFAAVLEHTSNARACERHWQQRIQASLNKQQKAAEEWQQQVQQEREQRITRMKEATNRLVAEIRTNYAEQVAEAESATRTELAALRAGHQQQVAERESEFETQLQAELRRLEEQLETELEAGRVRIESRRRQLQSDRRALVAEWKDDLSRLQDFVRTCREAAAGRSRWPNATDQKWVVPTTMPAAVVAGDILSTLPAISRGSDAELVTTTIDVPALLRFPQDLAVHVDHDSAGREPALDFVRGLLLKLLTGIPPGRVQFTLIDPVGLGQSFSALMHLADYDELIISNRIWTESSQIREQLQKVTEHMENIFQTYLRSEFDTIEQYNQAAGEVAEPYHFVVVAGFPNGFSEESARHLTSILTSGPRCGVYAIVLSVIGQAVPRVFDPDDLKLHCRRFVVRDGTVLPVHEDQIIDPASHVEFESLRPPSPGDSVNLVRLVGEHSRDARRVEVSFQRISPKPETIWSHSTAEGIDLPIGRSGAARLQYMRLGRGTNQHVLVAGKTGSGKSTLLHILVTNLALHYSPQEIQFYLIDFKKGVEFRTYAANHLPHARVVAIESDREFGLSVLERLDEILQERGELFRSKGVQDVPSFRKQYPSEPMPRLLLLIDEFQEFFVAEDRVSSRAALLLDRLIRQGRAFGMHVLLGSQTLGGAYSLARSTLGQVAVRIALQCSESDAHLILSEDNSAARLLSRPGEAIYNDANGLLEGNHPFQIAWLEEEQREELIEDLRRRRTSSGTDAHRMVVFEGNVPPSVELCSPLHQWLTESHQRETDAATVWLGEPVAIAEPTRVELRRAGGQNLLIVGQESEMADALLLMAAICQGSGAVSGGPDQPEYSVHMLHDGRDRDSLTRIRAAVSKDHLPRCQLVVGNDGDALIETLHQELEYRESGSELPSKLLVIRNIGQFRSLRKEEEEFSFGSYGETKTVTPASRLSDIIKRGPLVGLHVVIWSDSYSNAVRWLTTTLLREFENRVAFRMNATDSASLIDSPAASAMTPGRAILYRDQTGSVEKFRPFCWPSALWLERMDRMKPAASDSDSEPDYDIDSLTIE